MQKDASGQWKCLYCDYRNINKGNTEQHIETKHISVQYSCDYCDTVCPSKKALHMHKTRRHKFL